MGCCCSLPDTFPPASEPYMMQHPTVNNFYFYTDNPECIQRVEEVIAKVQNPHVALNRSTSSPLFVVSPVAS